MARLLTAATTAQLSSQIVRPALMLSLGLQDQTIYVWSGVGDVEWGGNTFKGVGTLGKISDISETSDQSATGCSIELSGIDNTLLMESLLDIRVGRPATIWLAFFDENGLVIPDPLILFRGRVDQPTTTVGTSHSTIRISLESRLNDQRRAMITRLTSEDQHRKWPNDRGLSFTPQLADAAWKWGN